MSSDIRMIDASLEIVFDLANKDNEGYMREYTHLADNEQDAIGQWLRMAKAKGETSESDPVLMNLMVELYRKMDRLERLLTQTGPQWLQLDHKAAIERIGVEHFELSEPKMEMGEAYYGRIILPSLSAKETGIFFEAISPTLAHITKIRAQDENEWVAFMRTRERAMIREMKGTVL